MISNIIEYILMAMLVCALLGIAGLEVYDLIKRIKDK